jgi:hypothetical protein
MFIYLDVKVQNIALKENVFELRLIDVTKRFQPKITTDLSQIKMDFTYLS